ncbi:MAG: phage holin family protein [Pyrinomonadaceae bacterium]
MLRSEVREELSHAKDAALSLSTGAGLVATGGVLSSFMLVRLLHSSTRLPLWACYGVVGGLLGATGAGLLSFGARKLAATQLLPPPQTAQAIKENLTWLKEQTEISS